MLVCHSVSSKSEPKRPNRDISSRWESSNVSSNVLRSEEETQGRESGWEGGRGCENEPSWMRADEDKSLRSSFLIGKWNKESLLLLFQYFLSFLSFQVISL